MGSKLTKCEPAKLKIANVNLPRSGCVPCTTSGGNETAQQNESANLPRRSSLKLPSLLILMNASCGRLPSTTLAMASSSGTAERRMPIESFVNWHTASLLFQRQWLCMLLVSAVNLLASTRGTFVGAVRRRTWRTPLKIKQLGGFNDLKAAA